MFALGRKGTTEVWYILRRLNMCEVVPATLCMVIYYRHTSEILWVQLHTTAVKQILQESEFNEFFGFPVHLRVISYTIALSLKKKKVYIP